MKGVMRVVTTCEVIESIESDLTILHGFEVLSTGFAGSGAEEADLLFGGEFVH